MRLVPCALAVVATALVGCSATGPAGGGPAPAPSGSRSSAAPGPAASSASPPGRVQVQVSPVSTRVDEPFSTVVTGLAPGTRTTLRLTTTDANGAVWRSDAVYRANPAGVVAAADAPESAPFGRDDAMGLVTSATTARSDVVFEPPEHWTMTVTALVDGRAVGSATATREWPDVDTYELSRTEDGVAGVLALPPAEQVTGPAVVVVGLPFLGSAPDVAVLLASHGLPALAVQLFGDAGLPEHLERVPVETIRDAARLLAEQDGVDTRRIGVLGLSGGSEGALLAAGTFPQTFENAVVVSSPWGTSSGMRTDDVESTAPAWSVRGKDVPATPEDLAQPDPKDPWILPVHRVRGSVTLVCGEADTVIAACPSARAMQKQRAAVGRGGDTRVLAYNGAGHCIAALLPYLPSSRKNVTPDLPCGGEPAVDNAAVARVWPTILAALGAPR